MKSRSITVGGALAALVIAIGATPAAAGSNVGAVYTLTNSAAGNAVIAYARGSDGSLSSLGSFPTGGLGTGGGLGSQGAVTISGDGEWLLAVDAGSDEISSFRIRDDHRLALVDRVASGGDRPISVTISGDVVYVLNDGGSGNIAGFTIDDGELSPIPSSSRPLSTSASAPAQVQFSPDGHALVVTEKATNRITTYAVDGDGLASAPSWIASAGLTPFGFDFDNKGRVVASEAFGGAPNASTVSTYGVSGSGASLIDGPVATTETAACWLVVTNNGRFAYAANTGSGTVSGFAIDPDGSLERLDGDGVTAVTPGPAADLGLSVNSRFLYVRAGGTIHALAVHPDGSLSNLGSTTVQAGIVGLAAA